MFWFFELPSRLRYLEGRVKDLERELMLLKLRSKT